MADAKDGAHKKWASLGALVTLQVNVGLMHKLSQKSSSSYAYSTFSALAIAEATKFAISAFLNSRSSDRHLCTLPVSKNEGMPSRSLAFRVVHLRILALALMHCINNQLTIFLFTIFLTADPSSMNIFKSGSTFITAS